jgi:Flp pilus assembly pilin Flp
VLRLSRFAREAEGLATIEYIIGAAVILGTLVVGVSSWNQGLVSRLQALVTQLASVR